MERERKRDREMGLIGCLITKIGGSRSKFSEYHVTPYLQCFHWCPSSFIPAPITEMSHKDKLKEVAQIVAPPVFFCFAVMSRKCVSWILMYFRQGCMMLPRVFYDGV